ncbi:MAG: sensor histidine kinase [Kiritimatiellae bacterium]|nr:sensor histidine kinase [Kiritimatiellia bacterium]
MKFLLTLCITMLAGGIAAKPLWETYPVVIDGIVKSVRHDDLDIDWYRAELETPSNTLKVAIAANAIPYDKLYGTIDAKVRVTGNMWKYANVFHSKYNMLDTSKPFEILEPPPKDPFTAVLFKDRQSTPTGHRHRFSGIVIATCNGKIYIRKDYRNLIEAFLARDQPVPPIGSAVTVVGFPVRVMRRYIFRESLLRIDAPPIPSDTQEITDVDVEELFTVSNSTPKVSWLFNGKVIRIRGTAISGYTEEIDSMLLKCEKRTIRVNMDFPGGYRNDIALGSKIEVTGMCLHDFDDHPLDTIIPRFRGIVVLPRSADDIRILAAPSWWTPARFAIITALLVLIIVVILIHNRILKALASRKGRELYNEQIDHAKAELKVEERTRLAVEIHDSMSQMLTGTALQIDAAMRIGDKGFDAAKGYLHNARQMLASCRHELRCCLWDLRSRTFEEKNMAEAVERTIANHLGQTASTVRFNVPREALSDSDAHVVLRIIRELTVNAIRHGHASYVKIAGELKDGFIKFSVRDDGCGFDPKTAKGPEQGHFGIQGIRERVAAINGSIDIRSVPGKGTRITVSIPAESGEK